MMPLTATQRNVLSMVGRWNDEHDGGNYSTDDQFQLRSLEALERRRLVERRGHGGLWWITEKGREVAGL